MKCESGNRADEGEEGQGGRERTEAGRARAGGAPWRRRALPCNLPDPRNERKERKRPAPSQLVVLPEVVVLAAAAALGAARGGVHLGHDGAAHVLHLLQLLLVVLLLRVLQQGIM